MRVLVTGGAGFVGSHVVETLAAAGYDVRVLDTVERTPPAGVEQVRGDVRDASDVAAALAGVDLVCHQAAKVGLGVDLVDDLPAYVGTNDAGTAVLLAEMARRGTPRLVLASSMVVYGEGGYSCPADGDVRPLPRESADLRAGRYEPRCPRCGGPLVMRRVTEAAPLDPRNVYAATKVAQEHLAAAWARGTGGSAVALRYHNVYGPRMPRDTPYAGVASIFRSALRRGEPPRVFEDGAQCRDFVHVRDVAAANAAAVAANAAAVAANAAAVAATPVPGELRAYNVASGEPHTIGELAAAFAETCGGPPPVVTGEFRLGDVRHVVAAPDLIAAELGFRASVRLTDGVGELVTS